MPAPHCLILPAMLLSLCSALLAQDPINPETSSKLYWTDSSGIHRSNLDGSSVEEGLITADRRRPTTMALDAPSRRIYWASPAQWPGDFQIWSSDFDGSNLELLAQVVGPHWDFPSIIIDSVNHRMYLGIRESRQQRGGIFALDLQRHEGLPYIVELLQGSQVPYSVDDLAVDPTESQVYFLDSWDGNLYVAPFLDGIAEYYDSYIDSSSFFDSLSSEWIHTSFDTFWKPYAPRRLIESRLLAFALDLENNPPKVYWIEIEQAGDNSYTYAVRRADLDGSNIELVLPDVPHGPAELSVEKGRLYWLDSLGGIMRARLDGSDVEPVQESVEALHFDVYDGKVFWTDRNGRVRRSRADGSGLVDLFAPTVRYPNSLAVNSSNGRLYWTDSLVGAIRSANLDGSSSQVLLSNLAAPRAIFSTRDRLFWVVDDRITGSRTVQSSALDGSDVGNVLEGRYPGDLVVDEVRSKLYWTRELCSELGDNILSANLDGSGLDSLSGGGCPNHISLNELTGRVFWTEGQAVWMADFAESTYMEVFSSIEGEAEAIAIDGSGGLVYWTEADSGPGSPGASLRLHRADLDGSGLETIRGPVPYERGHFVDLTLYLPRHTGVSASLALPSTTFLHANYPNPFNGSTRIPYSLSEPGPVSLTIYNSLGQPVRTIANQAQSAGFHQASWDGRDDGGRPLASGVYLYRLVSPHMAIAQRLTLLR